MTVRIGISGWTYAPWRGVFYPKGLPQARELAFAAAHFPTIEVNGTFYGLQRPDAFATWYEATPADFMFSVKASRYLTHLKRLRDAEQPLANFFASGLLRLGRKLGPLLWQLPPNFRFDPDRLDRFLTLLPRTAGEAAAHARGHDARLAGRAWTETDVPSHPVRHALEIRHSSWRTPEFAALLRRHEVALVVADSVAWPLLGDATAPFVYVRLHGSEQLYASGYDPPAIAIWARRVRRWSCGGTPDDLETLAQPAPATPRDVYVYFDNDAKIRAPFDAEALANALTADTAQAAPLPPPPARR